MTAGGLICVEPGTALQAANDEDGDLIVYADGDPLEREHAEVLDPAVYELCAAGSR